MFEDAYKDEMSGVHASEALIDDTLKKMQAEQSRLQAEQSGFQGQYDAGAPDGLRMIHGAAPAAAPAAAQPEKRKRRSLVLTIGLPAAACLVLAFFGATLYTQITGGSEQDYAFQLVEGGTSLAGDLQFGSVGEQSSNAASELRRAECLEPMLPSGILDADPVTFGEQSVYLGFDEEMQTYYAAYLKEGSRKTWVLLQSTSLDEKGFIKALKDYFK